MTPTRDDLRNGCRRDGAPLRAKLTYHCPEHLVSLGPAEMAQFDRKIIG